MPRPEKEWIVRYTDLAEASGLEIQSIQKAVSRGLLEPDRVESIAMWLARHGRPDIKMRMLHALARIAPEDLALKRRKQRRRKATTTA